MRKDGLLLLLALLLAFLSGKIMFSIQAENEIDFNDLERIRKLHLTLQQNLTPYRRLDLTTDYSNLEKKKLLDVSKKFSEKKIVLNSSECLKAKIEQISSSFVNKENLWLGYLCHQISSLPRNFFTSPPYLHSNGLSYSYMQYRMYKNESRRRAFFLDHSEYMHISELKKLGWSRNYNLKFLINLDNRSIKNITDGLNIFMNKDLYFIKTAPQRYFIIEREKAEDYFALARYSISQSNPSCELNIQDICWEKTPQDLSSFLSQSSSLLFIFTLVILIVIAIGLTTRIRKQKLEEEKKKHALRVLTHELRTPIAALLLQLNNINEDELSEHLSEKLAQIEGEVYRLKFLADKSRSYLQTDQEVAQVFRPEELPSIKEFLEGIIADYRDTDIALGPFSDTSIEIDPYWLELCVKNIIENSIRYGKAPIKITFETFGNQFSITVTDQGEIAYKNIKEILKSKHENSVGLGIGLMIVYKTIKQMGGELTLETAPTRFKITLPRSKNA